MTLPNPGDTLAAAVDAPLVPMPDPAQFCATKVFGDIAPRDINRFPALESSSGFRGRLDSGEPKGISLERIHRLRRLPLLGTRQQASKRNHRPRNVGLSGLPPAGSTMTVA